MPKHDLPVYAIVELLMRLELFNKSIGNYKNHNITSEKVMVKTSTGTINFTEALIMQQFEDPGLISDNTLHQLSSSFKPYANQNGKGIQV